MATLHEETPWHLPYTAQQLQNAAENQVPIVGDDGCWWRWNIETSSWQNTNIIAKGEDGAGSNPNLLTNWYFPDPINQRGKTSYTGAGYTIDRWKIIKDGSASLTLSGNGITFTKASGSYADVRQTFSAEEFNAIKNQGYVFSALIDGELVRLDSPSTVSSFSGGYLYAAENSFFIRLVVNKSISVVAAKLEVGSQQTLARQTASGLWVLNDPAPDPAAELAKCQRYQQVLRSTSGWFMAAVGSRYPQAQSCRMLMSLPVSMANTPAVVVQGQMALMSGTEGIDTALWPKVTAITPDSLTTNTLSLSVTVDRELASGTPYYLWAIQGDAENQIILDANL